MKDLKEIIEKLNNKWLELQKDFYICYDVKELAYKVNYDILSTLYEDYGGEVQVYYKYWNNGLWII